MSLFFAIGFPYGFINVVLSRLGRNDTVFTNQFSDSVSSIFKN